MPWFCPVEKKAYRQRSGEPEPEEALSVFKGPNGIAMAVFAQCPPVRRRDAPRQSDPDRLPKMNLAHLNRNIDDVTPDHPELTARSLLKPRAITQISY